MKKLLLHIILLLLTNQLFAQLPVDKNGWTTITPLPDSKIIYVSSSVGDNSNNGLSPETPVATLSKAKSIARAGYPDHILLKKGDEWTTEFGLGSFHSGRSAEEPTVISYYGDGNKRPLIKCDDSFIYVFGKTLSHIAIIGIEFYAYKHDPNSPDYENKLGQSAISYINASGENLLIEDCKFNYMQMGAYTAEETGALKNFKFRRNIILHSWAGDSYYIHELRTRVQGMYISGTEGILIEENLFDHNGWNEQIDSAGANMFNHNIYMQGGNPNPDKIWIKGNILARPAAHGLQLRSGGHCEDNLFIQCAVNVNVGYDYKAHKMDYMLDYVKHQKTTTLKNNVILETRLMDSTNTGYPRTSAKYGINTIHIPCIVHNNIMAHSLNKGGEPLGGYEDINQLSGSVDYVNNIIYKWFTYNNSHTRETENPGWFDPDRQIKHYHEKLGKEASTIAFLNEARKRPVNIWWTEYSAYAVNQYIREGFKTGKTDDTPPTTPQNIQKIYTTDATIEIQWDRATDNERLIGYNVYVNNEKYNETLLSVETITIKSLEPETNYTIAIEAIDVAGNPSASKAIVEIETLHIDTVAPVPPANVQANNITAQSLQLQWDATTDNRLVIGYNVYCNDKKVNDELLETTIYQINDLTMATSYTFKVTAIDGAGNESGANDILTVRTLDTQKPSTPENIVVDNIAENSVDISWDASSDNYQLAGYNIYVDSEKIATTEATSYTLTGLTTGQEYTISIEALDADGNTSRKTKPLTITLTALKNHKNQFIHIYPNPVLDKIYFNTAKPVRSISFFNIAGNCVIEKKDIQSGTHCFYIKKLPHGMYIIKIKNIDNEVIIEKIIKF